MEIIELVEQFGFTTIMVVGLGYFVYFVWQTISNVIDPAISEMKSTIIRLTDQLRLLDQDMIRIDTSVSSALGLSPDLDRIARSENFVEDGKIDARRD